MLSEGPFHASTLTRIRGSTSFHKGHFSDDDDPEGLDIGEHLKLLGNRYCQQFN